MNIFELCLLAACLGGLAAILSLCVVEIVLVEWSRMSYRSRWLFVTVFVISFALACAAILNH